MNQSISAPKPIGVTLLIALAFGVVALAGCMSGDGFGVKTPTASLAADQTEGWTGDAFVFNASASSNPNGNLARWHFDFGDGDSYETDDRRAAHNVTHAYDNGGIFNVTLTVSDDGTNQTGVKTATDVTVITVHEETRIHTQANSVTPADVGGSNERTVTFDANQRATSYDANLTLTSILLTGTSAVTMRVLDPAGEVLETKNFTVAAGEETTAELSGALTMSGQLVLELTVTSGSVTSDGLMRVHYA